MLRCLEKTPEKRFANVAELARALEPFGPPSVRTSVERIVRLEGSRATAGPSSIAIVPAQSSGPVSTLGQTEMTEAPIVPAGASVGAGTAAAWGSSRATTSKSRMTLIVAAGVAAALAVLGVAAVVLSSSHHPTSAAPTKPSADTPATTAAPVEPAAATPTVTVTATATATTTATATDTVAIPTIAHHHPPPPSPHGTATAKHAPTAAPLDTTGFGGRN